MRYVANCSFGKDSLAVVMINRLHHRIILAAYAVCYFIDITNAIGLQKSSEVFLTTGNCNKNGLTGHLINPPYSPHNRVRHSYARQHPLRVFFLYTRRNVPKLQ